MRHIFYTAHSKGDTVLTDKEVLQRYIDVLPFFGKVCGPGAELVVHDLSDPEHSLVAIENNISGRQIGNPMTDLVRELVRSGDHLSADFKADYVGKSKGKKFLSSTYYIKNEGRLIGFLCVNKDMDPVREATGALQCLLERFDLLPPQEGQASENLENPMTDLMHDRIAEIIAQSGVPPVRMSLEEKVRTVHRLNKDGVMMMKGAMAEIAKQLQVSVTTVYRYLNKDLD